MRNKTKKLQKELEKLGKAATICFLVRKTGNGEIHKVCLGKKKRGIGKGNYNGFGGKVADKPEFKNETIKESAVREGEEEFGITATELKEVGQIKFSTTEQGSHTTAHVFLVTKWENEPTESDEMRPRWFTLEQIPYDKMWVDDRYWLPHIVAGKKIRAEFVFDDDKTIAKKHIKIID